MTHLTLINNILELIKENDASHSFEHLLMKKCNITKEEADRISNMSFKDFWEDYIRDQ